MQMGRHTAQTQLTGNPGSETEAAAQMIISCNPQRTEMSLRDLRSHESRCFDQHIFVICMARVESENIIKIIISR